MDSPAESLLRFSECRRNAVLCLFKLLIRFAKPPRCYLIPPAMTPTKTPAAATTLTETVPATNTPGLAPSLVERLAQLLRGYPNRVKEVAFLRHGYGSRIPHFRHALGTIVVSFACPHAQSASVRLSPAASAGPAGAGRYFLRAAHRLPVEGAERHRDLFVQHGPQPLSSVGAGGRICPALERGPARLRRLNRTRF